MTSLESRLRSVACWLTVCVSLWSLSYFFAYGTKEGSAWIIEDLTVPLISQFDVSWENGARLVMLIAPLLVATTVCTLIVTTAPQPSQLQIWANWLFARFRGFSGLAGDGLTKKNQFGLGEVNFDVISVLLVTLPVFVFFVSTVNKVFKERELLSEEKLKAVGNAFGMAGTLALSFFLVPVTRHSVLLVAMGWSPLQALRVHIWAGYTSFVCIALHGLLHFVVWVRNEQLSLWDQVFPDSACWKWRPDDETTTPRECRSQWYNFTGVVAFLFMAVLIITSINWFRRRYYRLFYIFHVTCAIGMLLGAAMHWRPIVTFIAPSIIYYLASTVPALVQALASRCRGGVKVVKVIHLANAGGCKEIHISTTDAANTVLDTVPSMFVKMCVPSISLVWHPFTVFKHPRDPSTVRILFRPVGPFTKTLASRWEQEQHLPTVIDGFYHAGNRTLEALHHDHVTFYCGGVAITPFLSLIPDLIAEVAKRKERGQPVMTKKLIFFWACREEGLAAYITENYLKGMKLAADSIPGFDFGIVVYHTKRPAKPGPLDPIIKGGKDNSEESSNQLDTTFMSEMTLDVDGVEVMRQGSCANIDVDDFDEARRRRSSVDCEEPSTLALLAEEEHNNGAHQQVFEVTEYTYDKGAAHKMELQRFMPAQHARVWNNVPATLLIGGSLWVFFYIIFYYYNGYEVRVHEFYDRLWPLILCLLTSVAFGGAFEAGALVFTSAAETDKSSRRPPELNAAGYVPVDEEDTIHDESFLVDHRGGRPDASKIFFESREAECPGIFMCGPPAMTERVREEANKENSMFGLTRYAIYEDPFEM